MMKMKTKIFFFPLLLVALIFASCQKDTDLFIPDPTSPGLDTNWVAAVTDLSPVSDVKRLIRLVTIKQTIKEMPAILKAWLVPE